MLFRLEPIYAERVSILRAYEDGAGPTDPFKWACTLAGNDHSAMFKGLRAIDFESALVGSENRLALARTLAADDYREISFWRYRPGREPRMSHHRIVTPENAPELF